MMPVLCPACPPEPPCGLCHDHGVINPTLLYRHEPRHPAPLPGIATRVFEQVDLSWFSDDDWIRLRDVIAAIPACLIALSARAARRWAW